MPFIQVLARKGQNDNDGDEVELYGKHMREERRPMTIEEVQDKFRDLSPQHDEKNRKEVFDAIDNLENASIDDLLTPLRKTS